MIPDIKPRTEHETFVKDKCFELLEKYGENPKEHAKRLAIFIAQEMEDDYKPGVFNGQAPEIVLEYEALNTKDKYAHNKKYPEWRKMDEVVSYYKDKHAVGTNNSSHKHFLKESLEALGQDNSTEAMAAKGKLQQMLAKFQVSGQPVVEVNWHDQGQ
jgi:hypothetical protein